MLKNLKLSTFILGLACQLFANPSFSETALTNGAAVANLYGETGMGQMFKIDVPEDTAKLNVNISGGEGDADLYLRLDQEPTLRRYDCRPYKTGNDETCEVTGPSKGSYYILLQGYRAYSNLTLVATYTSVEQSGASGPQTLSLANGVAVNDLAGSTGESSDLYKIAIPAGAENLTVTTTGGSGDADLYVRKGSAPSDSTYDCRPYIGGNRETCSFISP